ncbi:MAG TPA: methyltransferase domain-containing protein [Thermoanaerobaculia bacterium]|nr:methyltransferase domain-containing protein [Thermoanaerobaculia bacterium]
MPHPIPPSETRTPDELREQLEVERELARRLREAKDTRGLYSAAYDEFHRRFPDHPVFQQDASALVALQVRLLEPFLTPRTRFLEVGGANCALTIELSKRLPHVIAIEAQAIAKPDHVEVVVADTPPYPLPDGCVDLAFSSHVIEHLRTDDAALHFRELHRVLAPGGRYICVTPNRLWGPHDVSRYFSDVPVGLHLAEYTHNDLLRMMQDAGFRKRRVIPEVGAGDGVHAATRITEAMLATAPLGVRRWALDALSRGRSEPFRLFEQVIVIGSR